LATRRLADRFESVADIGTSLGIKTMTEGVETQEQFDRLRAVGCTEMQGNLFSPASPASEVAVLMLGKTPFAEVA
jgi:EAL domain-containing protein (putative c-di-GMP-specific phosphodiesterase class I)